MAATRSAASSLLDNDDVVGDDARLGNGVSMMESFIAATLTAATSGRCGVAVISATIAGNDS